MKRRYVLLSASAVTIALALVAHWCFARKHQSRFNQLSNANVQWEANSFGMFAISDGETSGVVGEVCDSDIDTLIEMLGDKHRCGIAHVLLREAYNPTSFRDTFWGMPEEQDANAEWIIQGQDGSVYYPRFRQNEAKQYWTKIQKSSRVAQSGGWFLWYN